MWRVMSVNVLIHFWQNGHMNPPSTLTGIELIICNKTREEDGLLFLLLMSLVTMRFQRIKSRGRITTFVTLVRIFPSMSSNVAFHISSNFHEFFTKWAKKASFYFDWTISLQEIKRKMLHLFKKKQTFFSNDAFLYVVSSYKIENKHKYIGHI